MAVTNLLVFDHEPNPEHKSWEPRWSSPTVIGVDSERNSVYQVLIKNPNVRMVVLELYDGTRVGYSLVPKPKRDHVETEQTVA